MSSNDKLIAASKKICYELNALDLSLEELEGFLELIYLSYKVAKERTQGAS